MPTIFLSCVRVLPLGCMMLCPIYPRFFLPHVVALPRLVLFAILNTLTVPWRFGVISCLIHASSTPLRRLGHSIGLWCIQVHISFSEYHIWLLQCSWPTPFRSSEFSLFMFFVLFFFTFYYSSVYSYPLYYLLSSAISVFCCFLPSIGVPWAIVS